jgi:hypothetical protein
MELIEELIAQSAKNLMILPKFKNTLTQIRSSTVINRDVEALLNPILFSLEKLYLRNFKRS